MPMRCPSLRCPSSMSARVFGALVPALTAMTFTTMTFTTMTLTAMTTPSAAQVVDFGKYPDFKGQWVRKSNPNNWIPLAGPPPLTPEYEKIWDGIKADVKAGGPGNWPSTFCVPAGMPAMMSFYDPAEIIV